MDHCFEEGVAIHKQRNRVVKSHGQRQNQSRLAILTHGI